MDKPLILIDPLPRTLDSICDAPTRRRLESLGRLVISEDRAMPDEMVDRIFRKPSCCSAKPRCRAKGSNGQVG